LAENKKKKNNKNKGLKDSPEKPAENAGPKNNSEKGDKTVNKDMEKLKEELAAEKDRVLRLSAEFENYKKRKQREIDEFKKFANETVFKQFLTVIDNLERAIASAEENSDDKSLLEGVKLIYREILKICETFNVKPVDAENQPFDHNFHQAVNQEETDEFPENTVITVLQKGYVLHDRLLRPAMVVVSKKKTEKQEIKEN